MTNNLFKNLLSLAVVASMAFLYSCGEDEEPAPPALPSLDLTLTVGSTGEDFITGNEIAATDSLIISGSVSTPGGYNVVRISSSFFTSPIEWTRTDAGVDAGTEFVTLPSFVLELEEDLVGEEVDFTITVVDDANQSAEEFVNVNVGDVPSPDAQSAAMVTIEVITGDGASSTFYGIGENELFSHNDVVGTAEAVSPNIDLGYYFGATNMATIAAPAAWPNSVFDISAWGTKNDTDLKLSDLGQEDFMGLTTVADVDLAIADETFDAASNEVTELEAGDVIAFVTADTEPISGFILVNSITGTDGSDGEIELTFLLNVAAE